MNEKDFVVVDGVITEYVGDETDVVIPAKIGGEEIKAIGDSAFENTDIESVVISEGITRIGNYSFFSTPLTNIKFSDSVTEIGEGAFMETYIKEFFLPVNITKVESEALDTLSIEKVILPETLTDIADDAFDSELDVEIIKYPPEKVEEFKPKYMYMLLFDTNIVTDAEDYDYMDTDRGSKNFWVYDSYDKAKTKMLGILDEFASSNEIIYDFDNDIPVKSFGSDFAQRWLDKIYEELYWEVEDDLKNSATDRMINKLPEIISSYMKQKPVNKINIEKCNWNDYPHRIVIKNEENPSLYFSSEWGMHNKLIISLNNTKFLPDEKYTAFYIFTQDEYKNRIWLHVEIIKTAVD